MLVILAEQRRNENRLPGKRRLPVATGESLKIGLVEQAFQFAAALGFPLLGGFLLREIALILKLYYVFKLELAMAADGLAAAEHPCVRPSLYSGLAHIPHLCEFFC